MKNKQKKSRCRARIAVALLCMMSIFASLVIPAGATSTSDIVPTTGYIMIQFDPEHLYMNDAICTDGDWYQTASTSTLYYGKSINGTYSCVQLTGNLEVYLDTANHEPFIGLNNSDLISFYEMEEMIFDGSDTGPICDYVQLFITQETFNQIGFYLIALGGQVSHRQDIAFNAGYGEGYDEMWNIADERYNEIAEEAKYEGESIGYEKGYAAAEALHANDYQNGFAAGQTDAMNSTSSLKDMIFSIFSAPGDLINGILDFDLFGINMASLVKTLITLAITALIIVFLIKLMRR